jgi:hypothetical protein
MPGADGATSHDRHSSEWSKNMGLLYPSGLPSTSGREVEVELYIDGVCLSSSSAGDGTTIHTRRKTIYGQTRGTHDTP